MTVTIKLCDSDAILLSGVLARITSGELAVNEHTEKVCLNVVDTITKKFPADEIEDYVDVREFDLCFEDNKN